MKWKQKSSIGTGFAVYHKTVSEVKTAKFAIVTGCHIYFPRGRYCNTTDFIGMQQVRAK